jgi:hypothetical protein
LRTFEISNNNKTTEIMKAQNITIGQTIRFTPNNSTAIIEAKVLNINNDESLKVLKNNDATIQLWDAGYEVSTTVYPHQLIK